MANKYLPPSGPLAASCISQIRGCKLDQSCTATSPNNSLAGQETFYRAQASIPKAVTGTTTKFSEFYDASILTVGVTTVPETPSTYNNSNDGYITSVYDCNSVVTGENEKIYNFKLNNGNWIEKVEDLSSPNAACRSYTFFNLNAQNYTMYYQDGLNERYQQPVISGTVLINYGGSTNSYTIQRNLTR